MSKQLAKGDIRFIVLFEDQALSIPIVQTLVFVERSVAESGEPLLIFRHILSAGESEGFFVRERDEVELLHDADGLLSKLRRAFDGTIGNPSN